MCVFSFYTVLDAIIHWHKKKKHLIRPAKISLCDNATVGMIWKSYHEYMTDHKQMEFLREELVRGAEEWPMIRFCTTFDIGVVTLIACWRQGEGWPYLRNMTRPTKERLILLRHGLRAKRSTPLMRTQSIDHYSQQIHFSALPWTLKRLLALFDFWPHTFHVWHDIGPGRRILFSSLALYYQN